MANIIISNTKPKVATGLEDIVLYKIIDEKASPIEYGDVVILENLGRNITATATETRTKYSADNKVQGEIVNIADYSGTIELLQMPTDLSLIINGGFIDKTTGVIMPNLGDRPKFGMTYVRTYDDGTREAFIIPKIQFGQTMSMNATTQEDGAPAPQFFSTEILVFLTKIQDDRPPVANLSVRTDTEEYKEGFIESFRLGFPTMAMFELPTSPIVTIRAPRENKSTI